MNDSSPSRDGTPPRSQTFEVDVLMDEIVVRDSTTATTIKRRIHTEPDLVFDEMIETAPRKSAS